ncbi:MAG: IS200/IS605 family element transposase accessory protein TnpB [Gemmatimonadetes bacterium]|nr:IS200/IS605 family element transposase accessory protein TnpB [Gemmatimonadota bacterium]
MVSRRCLRAMARPSRLNGERRVGIHGPSPAPTTNERAFMASESKLVSRTVSRKAYLSKAGHRNLGELLAQLTWLWNIALHRRKQAWIERAESVSYYDQCKVLTKVRRDPLWSRFPVMAQRSALQRLDRAYKRFFDRVKAGGEKPGHPRFKPGDRGIRSFEVTTPVKTNGRWSWVNVKGMGRIRFRGRPPDGRIGLIRVCRTARRVKLQMVVEREVEVAPDRRPMVGIDMGIRARCALSTGETVPGVKLDRRELKRRQRRLSKAKRGSRNRRKRKAELAREWQRVREREHGALHELTAAIVRDYSANLAVEDLRIPNMVRNRRLSRSIHEQQWGAIVRMLGYKAESAGGSVTAVAPHHTSRECSGCARRRDMPLAVRVYRCTECGLVLDRDVNTARNVLQRGLAALNPGGDTPGCAEPTGRAGAVLPASA